jgi:myosin protein heavy chain
MAPAQGEAAETSERLVLTSQEALDVVGFSSHEQLELFRVPAVILHIGNLLLTGSGSDQAYFAPGSQSTAEKVCHLLGVTVVEFNKTVTRPKVKAGREWVTQSRTKKQAEDELAALCKFMYEKTFGWMVERINKALDRPSAKAQVFKPATPTRTDNQPVHRCPRYCGFRDLWQVPRLDGEFWSLTMQLRTATSSC